MSTGYKLAYRLGITPWEAAGEAGRAQLATLFDREEADRPAPFGKALDLGCGRGSHAIALAKRGWDTTGVDIVAKAVETAQQRAEADHVDVRFVPADVTTLSPAAVGSDFALFLDVGCFHGLRAEQRLAMGKSVSSVAAADATLLLLAFRPGRRGPLPGGASREDIERAFPGWSVTDVVTAETAGMPGPLKKAEPQWYRLQRR
jgi:SAM-dependent methyltransferase